MIMFYHFNKIKFPAYQLFVSMIKENELRTDTAIISSPHVDVESREYFLFQT